MKKRLVLLVTCACFLVSSGPLRAQQAPSDIRPFVALAYKVKGEDSYVRVGSGTILSSDGLILTNEHVYNFEDPQIDNSQVYVYYDHDNDRHTPSQITYVAQKLANWYSAFEEEPDYDIALIRIVKDFRTGQPISSPGFPYVPLGNPFDLPDGAIITILGFPSAGGQLLAVTSGPFVSYIEGSQFGIIDGAILTTADFWPGNSGGAALYKGRLIGLPTSVLTGTNEGANYVHPITWAGPLLSFVEYRQGISTPKIDMAWVKSTRNRDRWTRARSMVMGYVKADDTGQGLSGAQVMIYPADRSFDEISSLYEANKSRYPFVYERNGTVVYSVATTGNDGFFEAWIQRDGTFKLSIVKFGYSTFHSPNYTPADNVSQHFEKPFAVKPFTFENIIPPTDNTLFYQQKTTVLAIFGDAVPVYKKPESGAEIVHHLPNGTQVKILARHGVSSLSSYFQIEYPYTFLGNTYTYTGYIHTYDVPTSR